MAEYFYDAFISYRHKELDRQAAERIFKRLESFKIPRKAQNGSSTYPSGRVFLDEKELPTTDDLGKSIINALMKSKYLIVICSPDTPRSKYVRQEISVFISSGRADKIIPILVKGDIKDSFPDLLQKVFDPSGLYIDLRSHTTSGIMQRLDNNIVPIVQLITGLSEDNVRDIHSRAVVRKYIAIACAVLFFSAALAVIYSIGMAESKKYNDAYYSDNQTYNHLVSDYTMMNSNLFTKDQASAEKGLVFISGIIKDQTKMYQEAVISDISTQYQGYNVYFQTILENKAAALIKQGDIYLACNAPDKAIESYEEAVSVCEECDSYIDTLSSDNLLGSISGYIQVQFSRIYANALRKLGKTYIDQGMTDDAKTSLNAAVRVCNNVFDLKDAYNSNDPAITAYYADAEYYLGIIYNEENNRNEAGNCFRRFSADISSYFQTMDRRINADREVRNTANTFSLEYYMDLADIAEQYGICRDYSIYNGQNILKDALLKEIRAREEVDKYIPRLDNLYELADCYCQAADIYQNKNESKQQKIYADKEIALRNRISTMTASAGKTLEKANNIMKLAYNSTNAAAIDDFMQGLDMEIECLSNATVFGNNYADITACFNMADDMAYQAIYNGDYIKAEELCKKLRDWINAMDKQYAKANPGTQYCLQLQSAKVLHLTMKIDNDQKKYDAADEAFREAEAICKSYYEQNSQEAGIILAIVYADMALSKTLRQEYAKAIDLAENSVQINRNDMYCQVCLANIYLLAGRTADAEAIYNRYKDTKMQGDMTFSDLVKQQFDILRKNGISSSEMDRIEKWLGID